MSFSNISNEQIRKRMATSLEKKRLHKGIKSATLAEKGGHNVQTYSNFINKNSDIRISTLIDIFRGLGELDKLEALFEMRVPYSPLEKQSAPMVRVSKSSSLKVTSQSGSPSLEAVTSKHDKQVTIDSSNEEKKRKMDAAHAILSAITDKDSK